MAVESWNISTFGLGHTTMAALEEALARCSFAAIVATGDDETTSRGTASISPRDNVVFEFGLFVGRLGRSRAFLLVPHDAPDLRLPTDLLGVTVGLFRPGRDLVERREGMASVAEEVVEAIRKLGPVQAPTDPTLANDLLSSVSRQLTQLASGATSALQPARRQEWVQSLLTAVLDPFLARTEDAYAVWLVPGPDLRLDVAASSNLALDYQHHRWARAEGLVGRVWDTGSSAATSALDQHAWFELRPGCENQSYICAAVRSAADPSGVLAVGSDEGFPIHQGDQGLVRAYAAMLSLIEPQPMHSRPSVGRFERLVGVALGRGRQG